MDSHYDQVMSARDQAGAGVRPYFAYSTILDREAFLEWRGQHSYNFFDLPPGEIAIAQDLGLVYDFASNWWGGRVAGLVDAPGQQVHGVLFQIAEKDWPIIAHKEGGVTGMCVERKVKVSAGGKMVEAIAFTTNPARARTDGPVSQRFVEALVRGATAAKLPPEWVSALPSQAK